VAAFSNSFEEQHHYCIFLLEDPDTARDGFVSVIISGAGFSSKYWKFVGTFGDVALLRLSDAKF